MNGYDGYGDNYGDYPNYPIQGANQIRTLCAWGSVDSQEDSVAKLQTLDEFVDESEVESSNLMLGMTNSSSCEEGLECRIAMDFDDEDEGEGDEVNEQRDIDGFQEVVGSLGDKAAGAEVIDCFDCFECGDYYNFYKPGSCNLLVCPELVDQVSLGTFENSKN